MTSATSLRSFVAHAALVGGVMLAVAAPLAAQDVRYVIEGRVVAGEDERAVDGAEVEYNSRSILTTDDGYFRLTGVPRGRVVLNVRALGFEEARVELDVVADTSIIVRLTERPIALDPLEVDTRRITVRGRVVDPVHGLGVHDALVYVRPGDRSAETNATGRYRISRVPAIDSAMVVVEAFNFLPQRAWLTTGRDTTIDFTMQKDPVVEAIIGRQLARIEARADSLEYDVETISADSMNFSGTLRDILRYQFNFVGADCRIVDEKGQWEEPRGWRNAWELRYAESIHTIQIIGRGQSHRQRGSQHALMLRIYTKDYFRKLIGTSGDLRAIVVGRDIPAFECR